MKDYMLEEPMSQEEREELTREYDSWAGRENRWRREEEDEQRETEPDIQ